MFGRKKHKDIITETPRQLRKRNRQFMVVTYAVFFLLLSMAAYFVYFLGFKSESFIGSPYNQRLTEMSDKVIRGDIKSRDGVVLATTNVGTDGSESRQYPEGVKYAHAIGFSSNGMLGVEKDKNFYLLRSHSFIVKRLFNEIMEEKNQGDTLITTLDSRLQDRAYAALGGYKGAIVAMDPESGEIYTMVSKGDFDPNTVSGNWESLSSRADSVLINRATQGLYPPGSTFKIISALEYIKDGGNSSDRFICEGNFTHEEHNIHCYHNIVHGDISFREAFEKSCNTVFARIALMLNKTNMAKLATKLYFNTDLDIGVSNVSKSVFDVDSSTPDGLMMQTTIGQGNTLMTPIHMLMITSAIANKGVMVKPRIAKEIVNDEGTRVSTFRTEIMGTVFEKSEADLLRDYMRGVVTEGTSTLLNNDKYTAYGKTGSAEYNDNPNDSHSIFVGFAEGAEGKKLAIAIVMEGAGSGSEHAVPAAKEIFDVFFNN